jgi:hypothetical protein
MEELDLWREAGSGHEDSNILTLDALQVLSRSQVTLGLSISMRIRRICKDLSTYILYIHTYLTYMPLPYISKGLRNLSTGAGAQHCYVFCPMKVKMSRCVLSNSERPDVSEWVADLMWRCTFTNEQASQ